MSYESFVNKDTHSYWSSMRVWKKKKYIVPKKKKNKLAYFGNLSSILVMYYVTTELLWLSDYRYNPLLSFLVQKFRFSLLLYSYCTHTKSYLSVYQHYLKIQRHLSLICIYVPMPTIDLTLYYPVLWLVSFT